MRRVKPPLVTVVLPVFNASHTVGHAVESILHQTFTDWELVAVDDGSTDSTGAILADFAGQDARVRVVTVPHAGVAVAMNTGLSVARGPFIARMDADDESHPDRLVEQVKFLGTHPEVGVVGSLVEFGGNRVQAAGYALFVDWMNGLMTPEAIALNRFVESPLANPSVLFRSELVDQHGGCRDGDFPEDYEMWLRWLDAGVTITKVPRILLTWNDPPNRLTRTDARYDPEAFYRCKAFYLARWLHRHVASTRPILVWGAGRPTRKRAEHLTAHGIRIAGYIDIDPRKVGKRFGEREVIAPEQLPPAIEVFVLGYVAKRDARELARAFLSARGFVEGLDFLMAA